MAKQVIWSNKAKNDLFEILEYWHKRNKSKVYSNKLFLLISEAIEKLTSQQTPRRLTKFDEVYVKIIRDYKIFFKEDNTSLYIITIWDTRQNPEKLEKILR